MSGFAGPGSLLGPPPRPRPAKFPAWAGLAVSLALVAVSVVAIVLAVSRPAVTVKVCGHAWTVPAGGTLRITVTGPSCSDITVTGG